MMENDEPQGGLAYLPLFHDFRDRPCLVVGGGNVAERKVTMLRKAGARVVVVAPRLTDALAAMAADGAIRHERRPFQPEDTGGVAFIVAATAEAQTNRKVASAGAESNIPVNTVDDRAASTAIMPAVVDRSPLVVAICSGGASPVLTRRVRSRIEHELAPRLGDLAQLAEAYRSTVQNRLPDFDSRRRFWDRALSGPVGRAVLAGREPEARSALEAELDGTAGGPTAVGEVALVGAGPGDPDLLTLKAARLMEECDVIMHDPQVSTAILDRARRDAERVPVGKETGRHRKSQGEINELIKAHARAGKLVVRLKNGDPRLRGRSKQEWQALNEAGIPYQLVPGITANSGRNASATAP